MNALDVILLIPLIFGIVQGWRKGIIKAVATLIAVVTAIYMSRYFTPSIAEYIAQTTNLSYEWSVRLAYALLFFVIALSFHILAGMLTTILRTIKLGTVNRVSGAVFGFLKYLLILSVVLNILALGDPFLHYKQTNAVRHSLLYRPIEGAMPNLLPKIKFNDLIQHSLSDKKTE